jgi:hypothetical protein
MGSRTRLGNSSKDIGYRESSLSSFSSVKSADERRNDADGDGGDIDFDGSTRGVSNCQPTAMIYRSSWPWSLESFLCFVSKDLTLV